MKPRNIFHELPGKISEEFLSVIAKSGKVRVERIVSRGHRSPPGFWYDQDFDELVFLLRGAAILQVAGNRHPLRMGEGDYLLLPAHKRHRIEWTHPEKPTIWLIIRARRIVS